MTAASPASKNEHGPKGPSARHSVSQRPHGEPIKDAQNVILHQDPYRVSWSIVTWENEGGTVRGDTD